MKSKHPSFTRFILTQRLTPLAWQAQRLPRHGGVSARKFLFKIKAVSRGFSLVELVVVILVIGILTAISIQKFTSVESQFDRVAAQELESQLRYIRNLAMNRERTTRVVFSTASNNYTVSIGDTNGPGGFAAAKDPLTQKDWIVNIADKFPGVALSNVNMDGGTVVYFSGTNGIPCSSTNTPLTADGTITFNSGSRVTVVADTGYVSLSP